MTNKIEESANERFACRLYGWDDGKVYFWSLETSERCVSDEPALLRQLVAICAEYFQAYSTHGNE
jgi:hypothetical protein